MPVTGCKLFNFSGLALGGGRSERHKTTMKIRATIVACAIYTCALGAQTPDSRKITIPDVELVNQRGERVHFYTDLVKGKAVAIQTIFTTCTTICPPLGARWSQLQT